MINLNKTNFYIFSLFILAIFVFTIFLNVSLVNDIQKDSEEIIKQKEKLYLFQKQIQEFESFKKDESSYKLNLERLFINEETPIEFIQFLERESQVLGILIKISPIKIISRGEDLWENIGFRISLTGSFPKCMAFLQKIQLGRWLSDIERLEVNRISEKDVDTHKLENFFEGDVSFYINLKVYTKEENK